MNTRGRGETRTHAAHFFSLFLSNPSLSFWPILFLPSSSGSSRSSSSSSLFCILFSASNKRCKVVWYCNYPFLGTHNFFFLRSQIILYVLVCVFERERESGLCPLGLSVSLIKDRRLTERECVARLACRPRQQHTTPAVWRERANGRERVWVWWWWWGFVEEKESQMRGAGRCSYRNSHLPVSVFKSKQLRLSQKKCLVFFTGCFKGQDLNMHYGPHTLYF